MLKKIFPLFIVCVLSCNNGGDGLVDSIYQQLEKRLDNKLDEKIKQQVASKKENQQEEESKEKKQREEEEANKEERKQGEELNKRDETLSLGEDTVIEIDDSNQYVWIPTKKQYYIRTYPLNLDVRVDIKQEKDIINEELSITNAKLVSVSILADKKRLHYRGIKNLVELKNYFDYYNLYESTTSYMLNFVDDNQKTVKLKMDSVVNLNEILQSKETSSDKIDKMAISIKFSTMIENKHYSMYCNKFNKTGDKIKLFRKDNPDTNYLEISTKVSDIIDILADPNKLRDFIK
ncbi:hypothetical protein DB313_05190 (plasmid) [Borrelia turcica IST7]|uniref:Uncharacterized protein n=1 Tax=Borrelia turcica IST7 TaxID=1104446 RepID=A0A386PMY1_9SPIR|nr:hypothetical protein [Borrelia turcica]AYE36894.1 hypothetical protein DB313_05190 [Borrelia turcica IST7]